MINSRTSEVDAHFSIALQNISNRLDTANIRPKWGTVDHFAGQRIEIGLEDVFVGELCLLTDPKKRHEDFTAEVIAVSGGRAILSPHRHPDGLSRRTIAVPQGKPFEVSCGDSLLGTVLDGLGATIESNIPPLGEFEKRSIYSEPENPLNRPVIKDLLPTGVRVIDGFMPLGIGQKIAVIGETGAGKSTLIGMLSQNIKADVCVIGLVGERGREVREFLTHQMTAELRKKSVIVAATSDRPSMERVIAPYVATTIAEYFRDQGKSVLLIIDSVTRFARALREIGLAAGEPPARRGFPPSVFASIPRLVERAGLTEKGSITAIYTLLAEGDPESDPVAEEIRSLVDGNILLDRSLARAGHFPSISVAGSISRVITQIASPNQIKAANKIRLLMKKFEEVEILLQVGEYKKGADPVADMAIDTRNYLMKFLRQTASENTPFEETTARLEELAS